MCNMRESFAPVQRSAMLTALVRAPAMISKLRHLGVRRSGLSIENGVNLDLEVQRVEERVAPWFRNPTRLAFNNCPQTVGPARENSGPHLLRSGKGKTHHALWANHCMGIFGGEDPSPAAWRTGGQERRGPPTKIPKEELLVVRRRRCRRRERRRTAVYPLRPCCGSRTAT